MSIIYTYKGEIEHHVVCALPLGQHLFNTRTRLFEYIAEDEDIGRYIADDPDLQRDYNRIYRQYATGLLNASRHQAAFETLCDSINATAKPLSEFINEMTALDCEDEPSDCDMLEYMVDGIEAKLEVSCGFKQETFGEM